jgi:hypothetical protein
LAGLSAISSKYCPSFVLPSNHSHHTLPPSRFRDGHERATGFQRNDVTQFELVGHTVLLFDKTSILSVNHAL